MRDHHVRPVKIAGRQEDGWTEYLLRASRKRLGRRAAICHPSLVRISSGVRQPKMVTDETTDAGSDRVGPRIGNPNHRSCRRVKLDLRFQRQPADCEDYGDSGKCTFSSSVCTSNDGQSGATHRPEAGASALCACSSSSRRRSSATFALAPAASLCIISNQSTAMATVYYFCCSPPQEGPSRIGLLNFLACGTPDYLRDGPPDGIKIFDSLRRQLKQSIHPRGFSRSTRCCRNISATASPSTKSPRSA